MNQKDTSCVYFICERTTLFWTFSKTVAVLFQTGISVSNNPKPSSDDKVCDKIPSLS